MRDGTRSVRTQEHHSPPAQPLQEFVDTAPATYPGQEGEVLIMAIENTPHTALESARSAGEAMSVRRLFTAPGVPPFESVEWELRDARIGHGDRIVFEQPGVEFPRTWSQNATNIVAQKYFRGQLD